MSHNATATPAQQSGPWLSFNGQPRDPMTGWYPLGLGRRFYNPVLMRFHSADSLSPFAKGGLNAYAYCLGDPVNHIDPTGQVAQFIGPVLGGLANGLGLLSTALKGRALYKVHRTYRAEQGVGGSRQGWVATGTIDTQPARMNKFEVGLSILSGVSGLIGLGTSIARLINQDSDEVAYIGFAASAISILTTGFEVISLARATPWERYPINLNNFRLSNSAESPSLRGSVRSIRHEEEMTRL
ncbi:hypothetical protein PS627_03599 [Pseudomonas fluorescens]|uniref:RHS repeat-associated core domain-containing protein n=1 Tax=Pseudomonas fluorescens TaxID=294 RepID=UPI00125451C3|nr:RHS repeat-associated core domain-containing protein [Pseudomonas fluorescens]CAG8869598.1 hypothetical protein PS627_03599 [Pseudomonas fluorescens]VVP98943.1 hypothetical protein PS910_03615 [Pseudomonas fluorescens]